MDYSDEGDYTIIRRDRWDARILRRAFDNYIRDVSGSDARTHIFVTEGSDEDFEMKKDLDVAIWKLTDNWEGARSRMMKLQARHSS